MAVYRFFKVAAVRHVGFLKYKILTAVTLRSLRSVITRHRAKFRLD